MDKDDLARLGILASFLGIEPFCIDATFSQTTSRAWRTLTEGYLGEGRGQNLLKGILDQVMVRHSAETIIQERDLPGQPKLPGRTTEVIRLEPSR